MKKNIVIYNDDGVGEHGLESLLRFFEGQTVRQADAQAIAEGALTDADLFVMPGGADRPYARKLKGTGNAAIRRFVENGGSYLGICAGAYYACRAIEFHKGRDDEICEPRELRLIDAMAVGSIPDLAPFYDTTLKTATVTNISLGNILRPAFYHGGCYFKDVEQNAVVVGRYQDLNGLPAIIIKHVGKGMAILSGVHIETDGAQFGHGQEDLPSDALLSLLPLLDPALWNQSLQDWQESSAA